MAQDALAKTTVKNVMKERTVYVTMSGIYDEDTMRGAMKEMKDASLQYKGQDHLYLADMRGMKTAHPAVAQIFGEGIGWARRNGVVFCAHISDDTMQKLQTQRIARLASPMDPMTCDVDSVHEAKIVLGEVRERLLAGNALLSAQQVASGARA